MEKGIIYVVKENEPKPVSRTKKLVAAAVLLASLGGLAYAIIPRFSQSIQTAGSAQPTAVSKAPKVALWQSCHDKDACEDGYVCCVAPAANDQLIRKTTCRPSYDCGDWGKSIGNWRDCKIGFDSCSPGYECCVAPEDVFTGKSTCRQPWHCNRKWIETSAGGGSSGSTTTSTSSNNNAFRSGNSATLTYYTGNLFHCTGYNMPTGPAFAVNPLLLGYTVSDWHTRFSNQSPANIPWCGKKMKVTVNGKSIEGTIIDTCNPDDGCRWNTIDFYGQEGRNWLMGAVGDDFYQGTVSWEIY
jgi:hypothetical protein